MKELYAGKVHVSFAKDILPFTFFVKAAPFGQSSWKDKSLEVELQI